MLLLSSVRKILDFKLSLLCGNRNLIVWIFEKMLLVSLFSFFTIALQIMYFISFPKDFDVFLVNYC